MRDIISQVDSQDKPDYVEVARKSHELVHSHGAMNAYRYAAKLAAESAVDGTKKECSFWKAAAATLRPREESNRTLPRDLRHPLH